jgi:hypothetical protein
MITRLCTKVELKMPTPTTCVGLVVLTRWRIGQVYQTKAREGQSCTNFITPVGGHRGMIKTYRAIQAHYTWLNMRREIEAYVKQCKICQVNKSLTPRHKEPMEITTTAEQPFEKCYLDVVGPLPVTQKSNKYILNFQDDLSKYVVAMPLTQQDAETIARAFVEKVVLVYGTPRILQKDQGANFISELFKNTCKILGIKKIVYGVSSRITG